MVSLILPVLLSQLPLLKGFAPNPLEHAVKLADAVSFEGSCAGVPSGSVVTKDPVLVLDVSEGIKRLALQLPDRSMWLYAQGECSKNTALTLDVKPGKLEVFVITSSSSVESKEVKIKVLDLDGVRELPLNIKRVKSLPATVDGETSNDVPAAQLELSAQTDGIEWKLNGAASDVWVSSLAKAGEQAVKAPASLPAGKYALWVRGQKGTFSVTATSATAHVETAPAPVAAVPAPAPAPAPALAPAHDVVEVEPLKGWSHEAQEARKQAFLELPAERFVFAVADGEALLLISREEKSVNVLSVDGVESTLSSDEVSDKPASAVRLRAATLPEDVELTALTTENDPKLKSYEKLRKWTQKCLEHTPDDAKRCQVARLDKAKKKLEAELRKAFQKKHASELAQIEKRLKSLFDGHGEVAASR